jgi:AcrR family transcriptional regulator
MPDSRKPRQRTRTAGTGDKREAILEVAGRLFFAQGYAHTSVEQIVRELGVTKPFVYYYFASKQDIFETLAWRPARACFAAMDFAADDARPAHVKLRQGLARLIGATLAHYPAAFLPYLEPQVLRPAYVAAQRKLARQFYERMTALLEQGRREGSLDFADARLAALAACSLPGFLYTWYRPDGRLTPNELTEALVAMAMRLIGARAADPLQPHVTGAPDETVIETLEHRARRGGAARGLARASRGNLQGRLHRPAVGPVRQRR